MTATKPKFIDAHHHLWEPTTLEYGWLRQIGEPKPFGDPTPIQRDYVKDEFWTEACAEGAVASVHVQADGGLPDPVAESDWIVEQTTREPGLGVPNAWVGFANLRHDDVEATLAAHAARPGFRGVRHIVARTDAAPAMNFVPMELMQETVWQANFALLAKYNASFDLQLYPDQADDAVALFAKARVISPSSSTTAPGPISSSTRHKRGAVPAAEPALVPLGRRRCGSCPSCPTSAIKLSGLGMYHPNWSAQNCRVIFQTIVDAFGPSRVMLGSNFPVDKLFKSYSEVVDIWNEWLGELSDHEQSEIRTGAASRAYRLNL